MPPTAALSETVDVETPELVVLSYTIAGVGSRTYAALIDYLICFVGILLAYIGILTFLARSTGGLMRSSSTVWVFAALVLIQFAVLWGYYVLFEALFDGQTLGKRSQRLRVVLDGGYSVTFGASAVRNLVRLVDMQPFVLYAVGMTSMIFSKSGKRLGDMAAGTIVVKEELVRQPAVLAVSVPAPADADAAAPLLIHAALTDQEFTVLERFVQRRSELDAARRTALAHQLATRFAAALSTALSDGEGTSESGRLVRLYEAERTARGRGLAARQDTGAARERHAIIAAGSPRWATFAARLEKAQKRGLSNLGEEGVREFVREYRELTSDLARLRTAARGRETDEVFYLNRLASGAHNLLYRRRTITLPEVVNFLFVAVPREIRASATPILLAAALLFGPAAIAYTAVVRDPTVAATLLPASMLDRAEDGVRRAKAGDGYIPDPGLFRPLMATSIITNNVQVAFAAFALGITAGTMTVWVLLTNGVSLGAVFGLYASKGIAPLLLAFVAPHGVLELSAICISGGAGLLLAAALLVPGDRTRRSALVENGRRAIRLVAGAALLLVVAGSIEGFVSPIEWWPIQGKLAVSGLTLVVLYAYLRLAVRAGPATLTAPPATSARGTG
ncbi:MAG: stage II sporulation protein M [Gemmatimonadales bacterium]